MLHPLPAHPLLPGHTPSVPERAGQLANQQVLQQQHVDHKIANALMQKGTRMPDGTAKQVVELMAPYFETVGSVISTLQSDRRIKRLKRLSMEPLPCTPTQNRARSEWCSPGPGKGRPRGLPQPESGNSDGPRKVRPRKQTLDRSNPLAKQAPNSKDRQDPAIQAQLRLADQSQSVKPTAYFRRNREIRMNVFFRDAWLRRAEDCAGGTVKFQETRLVEGETLMVDS